MPKVIVFVFAGRQPNMELQLPMMTEVLATNTNPNVEFHVWNLARNVKDGRYLKTVESTQRMRLHHEYFGVRPWRDNLAKVWRHYTNKRYKDCLFVKLDDDIVFIESARFGEYVNAIDTNRGSVVSANVINNGACMRLEPGLWAEFEPLRYPLLDMHRHQKFAEMSHHFFFRNWRELVDGPVSVVPTEDWLSINMIGFDWATLNEIVGKIGEPSPNEISGRSFPLGRPIGDEGAVNMLPRKIVRGFTVAHLAFGPQLITEQLLCAWRGFYQKIGHEYLRTHANVLV